MERDKGQLVPEHPRDLLPMLSPQNLSPRLLDFLSELDRCTSRELVMLDTIPHLRPQQAHSDGHCVDHWADPNAICFFFDAAHIHETIIAHEMAHVWIDLVEDCEDARLMRDLSDTAKVRQVLYIQSFVLDRKVNDVIEARGFDTSIIASHQWDAVNWMAQAVAKGHQPATKREAVFSALTIAATLWEQGDPIKADPIASDSLQPRMDLDAALAALRQGVPIVYALAQDFAAAVRKHGYNSRAQLRDSIDECLRLAFEFTGEEFSIEKELVEIPPTEPDIDKWPKYFRGWPPVAKREIGKLMAQNKIRVGHPVRLTSLPTGRFSVSFLDQQGQWTPEFVLQQTPDFPPQNERLPMALPERKFRMTRLNPASQKMPLSNTRQLLAPCTSVGPTVPPVRNFTRHNSPVAQGRRNYMPGVGRWLNRDPLGFEGGDTNLYRYVENDSVNRVDPSGMDPFIGPDSPNFIGPVGPYNERELAAIRNVRKQARLPAPHLSTDALGEWIDKNLIFGSVSNLGTVSNEYEMGQASGGKLATAAIWAGGNVIVLAIDIATFGEAVSGGVAAVKSGSSMKGIGGLVLRRGTQSASERVIGNALRIRRLVRYVEPEELFEAGKALGGKTLEDGTILISRNLKGRILRETLKHELTHSILSAIGKGGIAAFRHHFNMTVLGRVQLAKYIEEAVAEAVGLLYRAPKGTKLNRLWQAIEFPVKQGYVNIDIVIGQGIIHSARLYNGGVSLGKKISDR